MEPSPTIFNALLSPAAVFLSTLPSEELQSDSIGKDDFLHLTGSIRESITKPDSPGWKLDGLESDGARYFITPLFMLGQPPLRIDIYIPDRHDRAQYDRGALPRAFAALSPRQVSEHILWALDHWSTHFSNFETLYRDMPFGSRILLETICSDVRQMTLHLVPDYSIEQQWLPLETLRAMWDTVIDWWPPALDLAELQLQSQAHEAISLVKIRQDPARLYVFKSLTRNLRQMYHELKMLLTVPAHQNLLTRPLYIVTKKGRFGGKVGVCGFLMEYYPLGTLRDMLRQDHSSHEPFNLRDRFRWARQLTSVLQHISTTNLGFYPDLKPDNVLLRDDDGVINTTLIDLEQRGGWYSWSPPEIYYIEYIENLALSPDIVQVIRTYYANLLREYLPSWKPVSRTERYRDSMHGYSTAWLALSPTERIAAQAFMLGKLLWCIFEGKGSINCGLGPDIFKEVDSDFRFPKFQRTPAQLRACISMCTAGAPEWRGRSRPFTICGGELKLFLASDTKCSESPDTSPEYRAPRFDVSEAQDLAQAWWKQEIDDAERFLKARILQMMPSPRLPNNLEQTEMLTQAYQRPSFKAVLYMLEETEKAVLS